MAQLMRENKSILKSLIEIREFLSPLKIELSHWPIEKTEKVRELLKKDDLQDNEKNELLLALDFRFEEQKKIYGYQTRDLVVLHQKTPLLEDMLSIFDKTHKHTDDEVRYIIDGSGVFGFVMPNGEHVLLTVEAEEYIRVPAETEHWFILDENRRIKAVRYFTSKEGWVAHYTHSAIKTAHPSQRLQLSQQLTDTARFFSQQGWCPARSSNFSARFDHQSFLVSRSGVDKRKIESSDFILVNNQGSLIDVTIAKPSAETLIHSYIYKIRPEARAVLHTHSLHGTRLSLKYAREKKIEWSDYEILKGLNGVTTHKTLVTLPIVSNSQDMNEIIAELQPIFSSPLKVYGFLIAGHGLYTWGSSVREAQRHIETFEFLLSCLAEDQ